MEIIFIIIVVVIIIAMVQNTKKFYKKEVEQLEIKHAQDLKRKWEHLSSEEIILSEKISDIDKYLLLRLHYYSDEEIKELFKTAQKEAKKAKLSEVKRKIAQKTQELYGNILSDDERQPIPDEVKMFVWQRDKGKCVKCGSQENLEFDHIIPFSKGGSNSKRNIQLLCEKCNRSKTDNII